MKQPELRWIEAGYQMLGEVGPEALKVDVLARQLGTSRSSFYHYFSDLEIFTDQLLQHHCFRGHQIALEARNCRSFENDFVALMANNPHDLMVNRQLRIHRHNPAYFLAFDHANGKVRDAILPVWAAYVNLDHDRILARELFDVMADLFYQRLSPGQLHPAAMHAFLIEFRALIGTLVRKSGLEQVNQ